MPGRKKAEIISFKVDPVLSASLQKIHNRSEFIRSAVLAALKTACPLCQGSGILTLDQHKHWQKFTRRHRVKECPDCHAVHLVCSSSHAAADKS